MTTDLARVLQAAKNSMINGRHAPHCYHAWVQGGGYVNDGSAVYDRADYLRQLERDVQSEIDNMGFASAYAEPGYTQPTRGILFANWNRFPKGLDRVLERMGFEIEWSDEWTTCDDCGKALRTSPDGYCWEPSYIDDENGLPLCKECKPEDDSEDDEDTDEDDSE